MPKRPDRKSELEFWKHITGDELFMQFASMEKEQRLQFMKALFGNAIGWLLIREALDDPESELLVLFNAYASRNYLEVENQVNLSIEMRRETKELLRIAVEYLHRRNRSPSPQILKRNAEIYRLRGEDSKKWSWGRLGRKFGIAPVTARQGFKRFKTWLAKQGFQNLNDFLGHHATADFNEGLQRHSRP